MNININEIYLKQKNEAINEDTTLKNIETNITSFVIKLSNMSLKFSKITQQKLSARTDCHFDTYLAKTNFAPMYFRVNYYHFVL